MQQSPCGKASCHLAGHVQNVKVRYSVSKSLPPDPVLSQINPVHILFP
jgi:hypothetical protein